MKDKAILILEDPKGNKRYSPILENILALPVALHLVHISAALGYRYLVLMSDVKYHSTRERDAITYNVNEPLSQRYFINAYHLGFKREDISAIGGELPAIGSIKANRFDGRRLKNHTFGIEPVRSMMEPEDEAYDIHLTKHHGEFEHTHPTALSASEKLIYDKRLEWIYAVSDIRNRQSESEHWRNTPTGKQVNRPIIEEIDL